MAGEKRIYGIVTATVQNPLRQIAVDGFPKAIEGTKTIVQPIGRQCAQHGHAVGQMRAKRALNLVYPRLGGAHKGKIDYSEAYEPITTIVLQCRDSFELAHVVDLLKEADIPFEEFFDTNPEYGEGEVRTAIATYPVDPEDLTGITDYLPLLRG